MKAKRTKLFRGKGTQKEGWITPELEKAILPTIPLGRIGRPEDGRT